MLKVEFSFYTKIYAYIILHILVKLSIFDPRGRPQSRPVVITIFTQSVRQFVRTYVRPFQNIKIKRQSLPAGTVGWPSGSFMTPVLSSLNLLIYAKLNNSLFCKVFCVFIGYISFVLDNIDISSFAPDLLIL